MKNTVITFIGAGNMARSLISGLIASHYDPKRIWVSDPHKEKLNFLNKEFGVYTTSHNKEAASLGDVVLLAVKPQSIREAIKDCALDGQRKNQLIMSVAAGISTEFIQQCLEKSLGIVRCMPNTPASLRCGMTALYANPDVSEEQKELAEAIMRAVGLTVWLSREDELNAVTALSGSGPAYFFLLMEILVQAGEGLGLSKELARTLTVQTALGAAKLALASSDSLEQLRQQITSAGGTTERALNVLKEQNIRESFIKAVQAAEQRSKELQAITSVL